MKAFNEFHDFSLRSSAVGIEEIGECCWYAHFKVDGDFSGLFPLIQSTADDVVHYEFPEHIRFRLNGISCSLYPPDIVASKFFYGREQALEFAQQLINYLNELERDKSRIKPDFKKKTRLHVPELLPFLPMTNCKECGFRTCMAFAGAVSRRKVRLNLCPHFPEPADARIIFTINDRNTDKIRTIEIDPDLAGVEISKVTARANIAQPPPKPTKSPERAKGMIANRDGVIFKLSGREMEVLRLITEGFTNREIAQILKISQNTVKSHVLHLFNKLGVNDRTQTAVWAVQNELI